MINLGRKTIVPPGYVDTQQLNAQLASKLVGVQGKNLFNKATVTTGYVVRETDGTLFADATRSTSDYISISPNTQYKKVNGDKLAFYDNTKVFISGYGNGTYTFTTPANAVYVRISVLNTALDTEQLELGSVSTTYESYTSKLDPKTIPNGIITKLMLAFDPVPDKSINDQKFTFTPLTGTKSKNLFNKDTVTVGKYIVHTTGTESVNAGFSASDFIPVLPNTQYKRKTTERHAVYDANKVYITGELSVNTFTTPANAAYVRLSVTNANVASEQLEVGSVSTAYESYYAKIDPNTIPSGVIAKSMLAFSALEGVPSKNLFNKATVVSGYYISHTDGNLSGGGTATGYNAGDFATILPNTTYTKKTNQRFAIYDSSKTFISGMLTGNTFTTPANAAYVRITVLDADLSTEQLEVGTVSTAYESYGVKLNINDLGNIPQSKIVTTNNVIVVKPDGTGNFTNLSSAIASITNSSANNKYDIYIYEGTYDVYSTLTPSELSGIGIVLPDYVNLIGVGDREKVILKTELADTTTNDESTRLSTLNVKYNNNMKNLTVIAKNCRYAVHADNSNLFKNYEQHFENCVFYHKGAVSGLWQVCNAWGEGTASGAKEYFKNCVFISDTLGGFSSHNNVNFTEPTYHEFDNCEFISALGYPSFKLLSMASTKRSKVVLNNCRFNGYIAHIEQTAGYGMEFDVTGSGNMVTPYKLDTTLANDQPFLKFSNELESNRNSSGAIITRGTPVKYSGSGFGVIPMATTDTKDKFAGICMQDSAVGDICHYKTKGYFYLGVTSLGELTKETYVGITNGQLAVVGTQTDAIGKVMWNGGHLKLY